MGQLLYPNPQDSPPISGAFFRLHVITEMNADKIDEFNP
jgi:hypothetical protein